MKNKSLILLALLLAAVLLLAACGQSSAPAQSAEETAQPEEAETAPGIEVPDELVGTWISVNNINDKIILIIHPLFFL